MHSAKPLICLHCEGAPSVNGLGLCRSCNAVGGIRVLYAVRRRDWTPEWERHLRRLAWRAQRGLPLFDDPPL
jgi:hypothetical protein